MPATVGLWEHFRRLADFSGREDRSSFWPYAALVYGIMTLCSMVAMFPLMMSMSRAVEQAAASGGKPPLPPFGGFIAGVTVVTLIGIAFYAAAVSRRLHDSGFSAPWGLMPLPFLLFSMVRMSDFFASVGVDQPDMGRFLEIFVSNLIYMITIVALIVMLARRSDPGPNRYDGGR